MNRYDSSSTRETSPQALWSAALELFCHQVLYVRHVYPRETFGTTRFLEVQCHVQRHPDVQKYLQEHVPVAVRALWEGEATEVSMVIYDASDSNLPEERFTLTFRKRAEGVVASTLEPEVRNLILSVLGLSGLQDEALRRRHRSPNLTFRVELYLPKSLPEGKDTNSQTPSLQAALDKGSWYAPGKDAEDREKEYRRPVCQLPQAQCHFTFDLSSSR